MADNELYNIKNVLDYQIFITIKYTTLSYKELYQVAYLGYLKAQKNYNPIYGKMSLKYATKYIRQELVKTLKHEYKHRDLAPGYDVQSDASQGEFMETNRTPNITVNYAAETIENPTTNPILKTIEMLLPKLSKVKQSIVYCTYFSEKPKTLQQLASQLKVSPQRVHQIKQEALSEIKDLLRDLQ